MSPYTNALWQPPKYPIPEADPRGLHIPYMLLPSSFSIGRQMGVKPQLYLMSQTAP